MGKVLFFVAILSLIASASSAQHQHGVDLYQHKDYPGAVAALEESSKSEPPGSTDFRESALLIGQSYFDMNEAPKAIPWLEKVGPLNEAYYMLGYAYFLNHQRAECEAAFAHLFDLKPNSAAGHLLAGQMLLKKEYEKEAAEEIHTALTLDPKIPEAHFLLGEIEIYSGHPDQGVEDMKLELSINPNYSMAWYRLGDAYSRQENWDAAVPSLQRAIWLNQFFSGPYILLGKCYLKQKNYFNAESILRRGLLLDPQNYSGTYLLVQTLMAQGNKEDAQPLLEKLKSMPHER
jgi:tetratricopeptide (TPR) repeat protein